MALLSKAGFIAAPATTVTGLGFRPGAIMFWTENATAFAVLNAGVDISYGFWCKPTPTAAPRAQAAWVGSNHVVASATVGRVAAGLDPQRAVANRTWALQGLTDTADGFTFTYTAAAPAATRIHYLAFNTDAKAQILTQTFSPANTVGSIVKVRGAGFTPSCVMAIAMPDPTLASKGLGFGVSDMQGAQWSEAGQSLTGVTPSNADRSWNETDIISLVDANGASACTMRLVGYEGDGFNLEVISAPTVTVTAYFLCLANLKSKATMQAKPITASPVSQTLVAGFQPVAAIFGSAMSTAAQRETHWYGSLGAIGGTPALSTRQMGWWAEYTNVATSSAVAMSLEINNWVLYHATPVGSGPTTPPSNYAQSAIFNATLTTTGVTLASGASNSAVAMRYGALMIGNLKHSLGGDATVDTDARTLPFWQPTLILGNESETDTRAESAFGLVALLGGDALVDIEAWNQVALSHKLGGQAIVDTEILSRVRLMHTLAGIVNVPIVAESFIWQAIPLRGESVVDTEVLARVALQHKVGGLGIVDTLAESYFFLELPIIPVANSNEMPGTVNWHINPGAEDGLEGWVPFGSGTIVDEEFLTVWEGAQSVKVDTPGLITGEGVIIESASGTQLTGQARLIWGSVFASGPGTVLDTYLRHFYTDGSVEEGTHEIKAPLTVAPNWQRLVAPPFALNPTKIYDHSEMRVLTSVIGVNTFYVDGAQVEEEHGAGVTAWVSGAYGFATGEWTGPPNRSISYRQPIQMQTILKGIGGELEVEVKLYRMTWDNRIIEDITDAVLQGNVSADPERDVTWAFDCTLTHEGWKRLNPNFDWVAPFVTIRKPDGTEATGQLGLYFVVPSKAEYDEYRGTVKLSAFDPLWLFARQGLTDFMVAGIGPDRSAFIRQLLDGAVLTGGQDEPPGVPARYFIPDVGQGFAKKREWAHDENRLEIANDIAESSGLFPLWTTSTGFILTRLRNEGRIKNRTPVRAWAANVPVGFVPVVPVPDLAKLEHEVLGRVPVTPKAFDLFDEIILTNDDPTLGKTRVKASMRRRNKKHPRKAGDKDDRNDRGDDNDDKDEHGRKKKKRKRAKKVRAPYVENVLTAQQVAVAIADEMSVRSEYISLAVLPDPTVALVRETVVTAIWDIAGNPVAVGHWLVNRVNYALWPSTPTMTMELSRIYHGADDIDIELEEIA